MTKTAYTRLFRPEALEYHARARGDTGSLTHPAAGWTRYGLSIVLGAGLLLGAGAAFLPVEYRAGHSGRVVDVRSRGVVVILDADAPTLHEGQALRLALDDAARTIRSMAIEATGNRAMCAGGQGMMCPGTDMPEFSAGGELLLLRLQPEAGPGHGLEPDMPVTLWIDEPRRRLWLVVAEQMGMIDDAE